MSMHLSSINHFVSELYPNDMFLLLARLMLHVLQEPAQLSESGQPEEQTS